MKTSSATATHRKTRVRRLSSLTLLTLLIVLLAWAPVVAAYGGDGNTHLRHTQLSEQEIADTHALTEQMKPGVPYMMNLADPVQHRYVTSHHARHGITRETAPAVYASFDAQREAAEPDAPQVDPAFSNANDGQLTSLNLIMNIDKTGTNAYSASALSSVPGGSHKTTILLELKVMPAGTVYHAISCGTGVKQNGCPETWDAGEDFVVSLSGTMPALTSGQSVQAWASIQVFPKNPALDAHHAARAEAVSDAASEAPVYVAYASDVSDAKTYCQSAPNYCNPATDANCKTGHYSNACVNDGTITSPIEACYGRNDGTCDYGYGGRGYPTNFELPVAGNMTCGSTLLTNGGKPIGSASLWLRNPSGGGCYLYAKQGDTQLTGFTPSGTKLSWNFPKTDFPNNGCVPHARGTLNYGLRINVAATQGPCAVLFTSDSKDKGLEVAKVPQIAILQGCLAGDTEILVAPGEVRPVQDFEGDHGETVISNQHGARRTVIGTTWGEDRTMIRIRDGRGNTLILSDTHPVVTESGVVAASDLVVGRHALINIEGKSVLAAKERIAWDNDVFNLTLGTEAEAARGETTMFANGILVGDSAMQQLQGHVTKALKRTHDDVLEALPERWHRDYRLWIETRSGAQGH